MKDILKLLRVKHYIKNLIILIPAFLTNQLLNPAMLFRLGVLFFVFCCAASIVYIINDLRDAKLDSNNPLKRDRPIASGSIPSSKAVILIPILFVGMLIAVYMCNDTIKDALTILLIPLVYIIINVAYTFGLKNIPLIDVFILSLGYILRMEYGGIIAECGLSRWMFLTIMSYAFFMGFGKRRGELFLNGDAGRESLKLYNVEFLDKGIYIFVTLAIVFYALACADIETFVAKSGIDLLWSVPIVIVISLRYVMILESGTCDGDPVSILLTDRVLLMLCVFYTLILIALFYL